MLAALLGLFGTMMFGSAVGGGGGDAPKAQSPGNTISDTNPVPEPVVADTTPDPDPVAADVEPPAAAPGPDDDVDIDPPAAAPDPVVVDIAPPAATPDPVVVDIDPPAATPDPVAADIEAPAAAPVSVTADVDARAAAPAPSLSSTDGPQTLAADLFSTGEVVDVDGGRVSTLELDADVPIAALEILEGPEHGNATVNPDNSIALVMSGSDYSGPLSVSYKVTFQDGTTEEHTMDLNVSVPTQDAGWGAGAHYMLEEDEDGDIIVETGENHRKIYVSESDDALSRADIAALENLDVSDITTQWLIDNPVYGGDEEMALATDVGMDIWRDTTRWTSEEPTSNWLLFERGYEYDADTLGRVIDRGVHGEDELHPLHITSWGEGARPELSGPVEIFQEPAANIVFSHLAFTGEVKNLAADNTLFSDVSITDKGIYVQNVDNFTLHDSEVAYVGRDTARPEGDTWGNPRVQGLFANDVDSILIEGSIIHHNGWEEDYREDGSTEGGLPPSNFSHNIYLQNNTTDVTLRDNIISEGSSFGAHVRGGGFVEDNAFLNNNMAIDFLGGIYKTDGAIGNYTLFSDNLVTSAGYKEVDNYSIGAFSAGFQNAAYDSTIIDNIVAHLADPNNPEEQAEKYYAHHAVQNDLDPVFDDTLIYNWEAQRGVDLEQNVEGLDRDVADDTTIQNFATALLGEEATIKEFVDHLLALSDTAYDDQTTADDIIAYFQEGFGIAPNGDEAQTDHRFVPNNLADGIRWDNRLNWDTEDVPDDGDNVVLAGNWVEYGGTTSLNDLDVGSGGRIDVNSGRLSVEGELSTGADGATISTQGAGQFWTDGYASDDQLNISVDGGRFANTGDITGTTSVLASDGQTLLGVDDALFVVQSGAELRVDGSEARVGFDGEAGGVSVLHMADASTLSFVSDEDGFSTLEEFRSGAFDQTGSDVQSGVSLDGTLQVDLSAYEGTNGVHTLIDVDALTGVLDDIHIHGLSDTQDAQIIVDYDTDALLLSLTSGTGAVHYDTIGAPDAESADALWQALTEGQGVYDEDDPDLHSSDEALPELF